MYGKYHDIRVYQHFTPIYSRVPYLDRQIFNVGTDSLRISRRADQRAADACQGIEKIRLQSQNLENSLRDSRRNREQNATRFINDLKDVQEVCLQKQKMVWSRYEQKREEDRLNHVKDQRYLDSLLKTNSTKAQSRLTSVRRWN